MARKHSAEPVEPVEPEAEAVATATIEADVLPVTEADLPKALEPDAPALLVTDPYPIATAITDAQTLCTQIVALANRASVGVALHTDRTHVLVIIHELTRVQRKLDYFVNHNAGW